MSLADGRRILRPEVATEATFDASAGAEGKDAVIPIHPEFRMFVSVSNVMEAF